MAQPIGSAPLRDLARGAKSVTILVPGKTRRAGVAEYTPILVEELNAAGVPDANITVVLATGTHEPHGPDDIKEVIGAELVTRVQCFRHDCRDDAGLIHVGTTTQGTKVRLSRAVVESDVIVLTGRIAPHYFAGLSGGGKALLPGVAGFDTILTNHARTLGLQQGLAPDARAFELADNPVHRDMDEVIHMVGPTFLLNTLMDIDHQIAGAVAGAPQAAHARGAELARQFYEHVATTQFDAVIASPGGAPYDCNFMQSLKAPMHTSALLKPGGALLWVAECAGKLHPGFCEWLAIQDDAELEAAIRSNYNLTGHNSLMLRRLLRQHPIALMSKLDASVVAALGFHPVGTLEEGCAWLRDKLSEQSAYAVVPHANLLAARAP